MKSFLEEMKASFYQWATEMLKADTPLDLPGLVVLRTMLEVRLRFLNCGTGTNRIAGPRRDTHVYCSFQVPIVLVEPGRLGRGENISSGKETLLVQSDTRFIYDPSLPVVVAWNGDNIFSPTKVCNQQAMDAHFVSSLWQQLQVAREHLERVQTSSWSAAEAGYLKTCDTSMKSCMSLCVSKLSKKPAKIQTGLKGPIQVIMCPTF